MKVYRSANPPTAGVWKNPAVPEERSIGIAETLVLKLQKANVAAMVAVHLHLKVILPFTGKEARFQSIWRITDVESVAVTVYPAFAGLRKSTNGIERC